MRDRSRILPQMQPAPLLLSLLSLLLCLGALCPLVAVAQAPVDPAPVEVRPGRSVTVIHNIDLVALAGYGPVGREVRVEIVRDGAVVGSTFGPTVNTPDGVGLEINHGPLGEAQPGECWNVTKDSTAHTSSCSGNLSCPRLSHSVSALIASDSFLSALVPLCVSLP
jgi:hypothetical protein